ncbi:unnamed protein product [Cochlearia groenlandica]
MYAEISRELSANEEPKGSFFYTHGPTDTMSWFSEHGVPLKVEDDGRVFPVSDNSSSVIDCLLHEANTKGVRLERGKTALTTSVKVDGKFHVKFGKQSSVIYEFIEEFLVSCLHRTFRLSSNFHL